MILSTGNSPNDRNEWTELVSSKRQYSKELRDLSEKIIEVDSSSRDLGKDIRTERTKLKESVYKLNSIKEKISVLNSELSKISENLSKSKGFLTLMESRVPKEDEQTLLAELLESKAKIDNNPTQSQFRKNETLEHYKMISMSLEAIKAVKMVKEQVSKLRSDSKDLNDKIMKADQEVSNLQSEMSKQNNTIDNLVSFKTLLQEKRQSIMNQYNQTINLLEKVNARLDTLATERKTLSGSRHSQSTSNKYKIMKIWNSYGSEHSANLVMIGKFKDAGSAEKAQAIIEEIKEYMMQSGDDHRDADRYSDAVMELLKRVNFFDVRPGELEQFTYDVSCRREGDRVTITTDESDVSAFLKVLVDKGARVEVYSAHTYPGTGEGR